MRDERALSALSALAVGVALLAMARVEAPSASEARSARSSSPFAVAPATDAAVGEGARALRDGEQVDLNQANAAELALLPGIGPTLAARIVAHREAEGRFASVDGLVDVRGVGPRTLSRIRAMAKVSQ